MTNNEKEPTVATAAPDETFDRAAFEMALESESGNLLQSQTQILLQRAAFLVLERDALKERVAALEALLPTEHKSDVEPPRARSQRRKAAAKKTAAAPAAGGQD